MVVWKCAAQNNFGFELALGVTKPNFIHNNISSDINGNVKSDHVNFISSFRVHYSNGDKDLFFVQLLYSKSGTMNYQLSNLRFQLDLDNETFSQNNSTFDMSYIGFGLGTSYTTNFNAFIDVSFNYVHHIDNIFNNVLSNGWDQMTNSTEGEFAKSNLLGNLGIGYKIGAWSGKIGYENFFKLYRIDSIFDESTSRGDLSVSLAYRFK